MADDVLPPLPAPAADPSTGAAPTRGVRPGQVLGGRYELTTLLARGGMADVWQGTDQLLERQVAVKVLHPHLADDAGFVGRFRTEAVAAARLTHPNIVSIFDTASSPPAEPGGAPIEAIVMELVRGHTLRQELDARGSLAPDAVVALGAAVADALEAAHRAGLVHRDVKPANILLCDDHRVKVTDFGIAKVRDDTSDRTQTGTMLGSVKYLSPEQVEGHPVDPRTDVYSLGVVLYECLTGRAPFVADTPAATALARLHTDPPRPRDLRAGVAPQLDNVVMRAMARNPAQRFASAAELRAALLATRAAAPVVDPDRTVAEPRPRPTTPAASPPGVHHAPVPVGPAAPASHPVDLTPTHARSPQRRSRRRWGATITVLLLVAGALTVAGVLLSQSGPGQDLVDTVRTQAGGTPSGPLTITSVTAFDPEGDGTESDAAAARAFDGDAATGWRSEQYDSRAFGNIKSGVGLVLAVDVPARFSTLTVSSPTKGWAAAVYVADAPATSLAEWGPPDAQATAIAGDVTFDLHGARGRAVLLWVTDLGDGPPRVSVQVNELALTGGT